MEPYPELLIAGIWTWKNLQDLLADHEWSRRCSVSRLANIRKSAYQVGLPSLTCLKDRMRYAIIDVTAGAGRAEPRLAGLIGTHTFTTQKPGQIEAHFGPVMILPEFQVSAPSTTIEAARG